MLGSGYMIDHRIPKVTLIYSTPLALAEIGARVCYDSFNLSENNLVKFFKNDIGHFKDKVKIDGDIDGSEVLDKLAWVHFHHSVLEHVNLSYFIQNIPRNVVLEFNRSRTGVSTSQKSSRYTIDVLINSFLDTIENPLGITNLEATTFHTVVKNNISVTDKDTVLNITKYLFDALYLLHSTEELIKDLKGGKKKHQNDRVKFILPECWVMDGLWTFNLRALEHFLKLRNNGSAYYGIREVAEEIIRVTPQKYLDLIIKNSNEDSN